MVCAREDLNLQPLRDQILSLARLPFRHARNRHQLAPGTAESQAFVAALCKPGENDNGHTPYSLRLSDTYTEPVRVVRVRERWTERKRVGAKRVPQEKEQNWIWVVAGDLDG